MCSELTDVQLRKNVDTVIKTACGYEKKTIAAFLKHMDHFLNILCHNRAFGNVSLLVNASVLSGYLLGIV